MTHIAGELQKAYESMSEDDRGTFWNMLGECVLQGENRAIVSSGEKFSIALSKLFSQNGVKAGDYR